MWVFTRVAVVSFQMVCLHVLSSVCALVFELATGCVLLRLVRFFFLHRPFVELYGVAYLPFSYSRLRWVACGRHDAFYALGP